MQARHCLDLLVGRLLPPRCVLCDAAGQLPALDLCAGCEADLPPPVAAQVPATVKRIVAAFAYESPVDVMVQALKYRGDLAVGRVLGSLLARRVRAEGEIAIDVLLPVPLHRARCAERGFNQSQEIARRAGRELGLPVEPTLASRGHAGRPQVGLPAAQRQANVRGAFLATGRVAGQRVAIIDDVVTTGSTVGELAGCLLESGAMAVEVWCVARAIQPQGTA